MDIAKISACPDCGSLDIVHDSRGQVICKECGLIYTPMKPLEEAFARERIAKRKPVKTVKPAKKKPAKKAAKKKKAPKKAAKKVRAKKKARKR